MQESSNNNVILYTSRWCAHSKGVERLLDNNGIRVHKINIDGNGEARQELIELNGGYASVPTLVFPDGSKLTEPAKERGPQRGPLFVPSETPFVLLLFL